MSTNQDVTEEEVPLSLVNECKHTSDSNSTPDPGPCIAEKTKFGPYTPTLILHGGSGAITRSHLPPALYKQYRSSLLRYLESVHASLRSGTSALDAACHAVSFMEDDPLFNCGRGSVFTEQGTIEMEASVMVSSVRGEGSGDCAFHFTGLPSVPVKRGASVSLIKGTRHPILLAREVLLAGGDGLGGVGTMHCQLAGQGVEEWGWKEKGLERKGPEWFWTRKRWREHLRDLEKQRAKEHDTSARTRAVSSGDGYEEKWTTRYLYSDLPAGAYEAADDLDPPTQGTVGAVCMDSWGNLAVATSTGGLTNKKVGRIGDTPTIGSGFWAESWNEDDTQQTEAVPPTSTNQVDGRTLTLPDRLSRAIDAGFGDILKDCLPTLSDLDHGSPDFLPPNPRTEHPPPIQEQPVPVQQMTPSNPIPDDGCHFSPPSRRAVAMSGTGNGDSFLRTSAVRTTAAMCRFGSYALNPVTLAKAVAMVAGPGGEIQRSAGERWQKTFEGQGGIIGIELYKDQKKGTVVFDFNCGGLWRAWLDEETGKPRVMVFKDDYQE